MSKFTEINFNFVEAENGVWQQMDLIQAIIMSRDLVFIEAGCATLKGH